MKVEVRYATEFGSSAIVIDVTEIPRFAKRFKMLSVKPYEEPNMISDWLEQNRNPEIDKQVEKESEYLSKQRLEKYSERFDNDKSPIGNPETWGKRVLTEEDIFNQRDIDAVTDYINKEQQKQHLIDIMQKDEELGLYDEPKQEQERMYSEEDMIKFALFLEIHLPMKPRKTHRQLLEQFKKK